MEHSGEKEEAKEAHPAEPPQKGLELRDLPCLLRAELWEFLESRADFKHRGRHYHR